VYSKEIFPFHPKLLTLEHKLKVLTLFIVIMFDLEFLIHILNLYIHNIDETKYCFAMNLKLQDSAPRGLPFLVVLSQLSSAQKWILTPTLLNQEIVAQNSIMKTKIISTI
jgi:hypothetical protein